MANATANKARRASQKPGKAVVTKPAEQRAALLQADAPATDPVAQALADAAATVQGEGSAIMAQAAQVLAEAGAVAPAPAAAPTVPRAVAAVPDCPPVEGKHGGVPLDKLPKSIAAKGTNMGVCPPELASVVFYPGRPFTARSGHNAEWAALAIKLASNGGATGKQLAQGGVPVHSIKAYIKRAWLVRTPPVVPQAAPATEQQATEQQATEQQATA